MEVFEYLVVGGSWDGSIKEGKLSEGTVQFSPRPQLIAVGPGNERRNGSFTSGKETYSVVRYRANDGKYYLFAVAPEVKDYRLDDILRVASKKPTPVK
ncbi:hypothetical protein [Yersinia alsatica]|uniref:hypothetical protein n=1 Tax=Yersinia alsatica TaxID=2890317 RepID=UPI0011A9105E|nr:hypothetical protein [Yersinia alsatica]